MSSMKDGYNHLYHVRPGKEDKQLTSGAWDITSVQGYDAKRKVVYFAGHGQAPRRSTWPRWTSRGG